MVTATRPVEQRSPTPWLAVGAVWLVLIALVGWGVRQLRDQIRQQIVARDGEILLAMARTQAGADDAESLLATEPFAIFVTIGRFEGIVAARLFDTNGGFLASVPDFVRESRVGAADLAEVRAGRPLSRFLPAVPLGEVFLSTNAAAAELPERVFPVVQVFVPLGRGSAGEGAGVAEFLIEGGSVAREFARLDRRLVANGGVVLVVALGLTGGVLRWAFRRLDRSHRLLAQRTDCLQRANQELAQSARVAALGAVTAHLVHGLRNPVSGLQSFVEAGPEGGAADGAVWQEALAATQRMQSLIQQVVRVLRDQHSDLAYEVTLNELAGLVVERVQAAASARGVRLESGGVEPGVLDNRSSGLLALMLTNLLENAIEATPRGGRVTLRLQTEAAGLTAEVSDEGSGLPAAVQEHLFRPQRSPKEGGSGLGLAITRQLALALGGSVTLVTTGPTGTTFRVALPPQPAAAPDALPTHFEPRPKASRA